MKKWLYYLLMITLLGTGINCARKKEKKYFDVVAKEEEKIVRDQHKYKINLLEKSAEELYEKGQEMEREASKKLLFGSTDWSLVADNLVQAAVYYNKALKKDPNFKEAQESLNNLYQDSIIEVFRDKNIKLNLGEYCELIEKKGNYIPEDEHPINVKVHIYSGDKYLGSTDWINISKNGDDYSLKGGEGTKSLLDLLEEK